MVSEENYIKLKVNGLLDLETLAKEYQISKEEVVNFHNQYCGIGEILPLHLPKYVPFIYLPKKNFETRNLGLLKSSSLNYPIGNSEKKYGTVIKYLHNNSQIHFEINIKREDNLIEIKKGRTYINNLEIENSIEKLFEKAEQAVYPLKISAGKDGSLSKIENEKEINERWNHDYFPKLKEYYVGETAEEILSKMDLTFRNFNSRKDYFLQSIFYKLFFLPFYQTYPNFTKKESLGFYFADIQENILYDADYFLSREYTRGTKIALRIKGEEQNNNFFEESEKGCIDWLYKFQKDTHELFSITGSVSTFDKGKELKIEFQIFEI